MEKLLLTVREAADVLSVSRSRVYELIYAEQLDSVKIGRSRRVPLASVRRLAEGQSASWTLAGLRVKARFTGCRTAAGAAL
jgi:excisionase family DNA binding protein